MMKRTRIPSFQKFIVETVLTYITKDNYTGYIVRIRANPDYRNPQQQEPPNYKKNNAKATRQKRNISHRPVMR